MDTYHDTIPVVWQGPYARLIPHRRRSKVDLLVAAVYLFNKDEATMTFVGDLDAAINALDAVPDVIWHERGRRVSVPLNADSREWIVSTVLPRIGIARLVQHVMIATDGIVQFIAEDYFAPWRSVVQTGPAVTGDMLNSLVGREMIDGYEWIEDRTETPSLMPDDQPTNVDEVTESTIREAQVIPMLLQACPGFGPSWQAHLDDWAEYEPDEDDRRNSKDGNYRGYYNDVNAFAHYLLERLHAGGNDGFPAAFAAIERMMLHGNDDIRQLLTIGLFEDLSDDAETSAQFLRWAGPYTRAGWYWVNGVRYTHSFFFETIAREIELRQSASDDRHPTG